MITKIKLEELTEKYETIDFIKSDPIQFPHRFNTEKDIEIAAFISSLFAYGNRKIFIKKLDELFEIMQNKPYEFVLNFTPEANGEKLQSRLGSQAQQQKTVNNCAQELQGFNYRFAKDFDIIEVFNILHKLYTEDKGLKALFEYGYNTPHFNLPTQGGSENHKIQNTLQAVTDYFYSNVQNEVGQGFYHLIPNPKNGGAMKRMCMFLRWMVRKGPVDLGIWDFVSPSELLIPLDVHVARLSREMALLTRSSNDFKAVLQLTENLKKLDKLDPTKFDFAIFGLGVDK